MELTGKVALVTGVRRVGAVVAEALARAGADVALVYHRSSDAAENTAGVVRALGRRAVTIRADLTRSDDSRRIVEDAAEQLGRLDIFVGLASVYASVPLAEITEQIWDEQLNVETRSPFLSIQAALPHMRRAGGGRIVLFSDWVSASGRPRYMGYAHYYTAKAATKALAEALALELAADRILVNVVAPGPILPPPDTTEDEKQQVARATPLGHWGGEEEIAKAVMFLLATDFVTGETLRVDGGRHLK